MPVSRKVDSYVCKCALNSVDHGLVQIGVRRLRAVCSGYASACSKRNRARSKQLDIFTIAQIGKYIQRISLAFPADRSAHFARQSKQVYIT